MSRILVTGSRDWSNYNTVVRALSVAIETLHADNPDLKTITIVHGGARGADRMSGRFVDQAISFLAGKGISLREEIHLPDWNTDGKAAGVIRNQKMVALGADIAVAFHKDRSRGTAHCIQACERAGIPVSVYKE